MRKERSVRKLNIKKKFDRVICFILVFMMLISSASFGVDDGAGSQSSGMAKRIANRLVESTKLKEIQWKTDDAVINSVFFVELPLLQEGNAKFIPEGNDSYRLSYATDRQYDCNVKVLIDGVEVAISDKMYYYDGYGPMIQIPGMYDPARADDGQYATADSLKGYEGKDISIVVEIVDIETAESDKVKIDNQNTIVENLSEDSPLKEALKKFFGALFAPVKFALKLIERIITLIILAVGDGILAMVSSAVGEPVTIDGVILGDVKKVSIDFWQDQDGIGYMASILKNVVNQWYSAFTDIALAVYVMVLLIIGIKILFASTGAGKAKYKDLLKDWVVGICMLLLFPYAMRMLVNVNDILVAYVAQAGKAERTKSVNVVNDEDIASSFGSDEFVEKMVGDEQLVPENTMMYMRNLARVQGRIPLAIIYLILIFQLIVILWTYYKRAFMVAFLIIIFPLVAMTYTIDKMSKGLAHTGAFNAWFKEFFVNVFVQLFHAVTYVTIVSAGVAAYKSNSNWFFMVLCISFLFQGEKILRKIFGVESAAGTMKDIGTSAMAAYAAMKKFAPKGNKKQKKPLREQDGDDWSEEDDEGETDADDETAQSTPQAPVTQGAMQNAQAIVNAGTNSGTSSVQNAQAKGISSARKVANAIGTAARSTIPKRVIGGAANIIGKGLGGMMGATYGLAAGDVGKAITYGIGGAAVGGGIARVATAPIRGISNAYSGRKLKKAVMHGDYDEAFKKAGLDMSSMEAKTADLIRKALAEQTSAAASRGEKVGEYKFWKTIEKNK